MAVLEAGASDFLTKQIDPCELAPRIRNALTMKEHQDQLRNYAHTLEEAVRVRTAFNPKAVDAFFSQREAILATQLELADPQ